MWTLGLCFVVQPMEAQHRPDNAVAAFRHGVALYCEAGCLTQLLCNAGSSEANSLPQPILNLAKRLSGFLHVPIDRPGLNSEGIEMTAGSCESQRQLDPAAL